MINLNPVFHKVFSIDRRLAIKLKSFADLIYISSAYLLKIIKRLIKKKIKFAYKWKRNWYVFLPKTFTNTLHHPLVEKGINLPNGQVIDINWQRVIEEAPPIVKQALTDFKFNFLTRDGELTIVGTTVEVVSSTLSPKNSTQFIPLSLGTFRATTEYTYGYSIKYDKNKMSTFNPGSSGTLKSSQIPAAFFEVCRALDAAENLRNGSNPGLPPRRNLSTTVSFDTGTIAVAATIPVTVSIQTDGSIDVKASDYLGLAYSAFNGGGGDLKSDTLPEAFLEMASMVAAAEKAITPADAQPNNVQIQFDLETGSATISANMPFTTAAATNGDVTIHAIDYL